MMLAGPARAEEDAEALTAAETEPAQARDIAAREIWSGAETFRSIWAFYTGLTYAPDGVARPGLRLRLTAGMSTYDDVQPQGKVRAVQPFADVLAGYQWQVGTVTVKAFAGVTGAADIQTAEQARDLWSQGRFGLKAALETWWTIDDRNWLSLDLAYAARQSVLWSRSRYGHRVLPQWSIGPEAGISGETAQLGARVGAFLRYDWAEGEIALAGGLARDVAGSTGTVAGREVSASAPYATLLWLQRF